MTEELEQKLPIPICAARRGSRQDMHGVGLVNSSRYSK